MQQIDANGLQIERNGQLQALTDLTELMPGDKLINNTNHAVTIQLPKAEGSPTVNYSHQIKDLEGASDTSI